MNKTELISFIAGKNSYSKAEVEKSINMFTDGISSAISAGNNISIPGFGTFSISKVEARQGTNPKNKEPLQVEAYNQVRLKVGQKLKDAANDRSSQDKEKVKAKKKVDKTKSDS